MTRCGFSDQAQHPCIRSGSEPGLLPTCEELPCLWHAIWPVSQPGPGVAAAAWLRIHGPYLVSVHPTALYLACMCCRWSSAYTSSVQDAFWRLSDVACSCFDPSTVLCAGACPTQHSPTALCPVQKSSILTTLRRSLQSSSTRGPPPNDTPASSAWAHIHMFPITLPLIRAGAAGAADNRWLGRGRAVSLVDCPTHAGQGYAHAWGSHVPLWQGASPLQVLLLVVWAALEGLLPWQYMSIPSGECMEVDSCLGSAWSDVTVRAGEGVAVGQSVEVERCLGRTLCAAARHWARVCCCLGVARYVKLTVQGPGFVGLPGSRDAACCLTHGAPGARARFAIVSCLQAHSPACRPGAAAACSWSGTSFVMLEIATCRQAVGGSRTTINSLAWALLY